MKLTHPHYLISILLSSMTASYAQTLTKDDNTTALGTGSSWIGGTAPSGIHIAQWSGTYNTAGSLSAALPGSALTWQGISIGTISGTAAGLVSIGGTGSAVAGSSLTIGSSGIDMSGANQNLVINAATINANVSQTWNVAAGRNLRLGTSGTGAANANLDGNNTSAVITIAGGGLVDMNQGTGSGSGLAGFSGKFVVESGATLRGIRNTTEAWGSNTSADAITLRGGTLAVGGILGTQGNWTWNTPIALSSATTSSIDQQIISGTGRSLKLNGMISGSGNLVFRETGTNDSFSSNDLGFILTGANTMSGTVTIGGATENGISGRLTSVRIGGVAGADTTTGAGTSGSLGTASVVNNGVLTLSRSDEWTFGNAVSGSGSLRIGGSVSGTSTQVVTVSGTNSYTGATTIGQGRMHLTGSMTSNISVQAAGRISGTGSTTGSLSTVAGAGILLSGGNTYAGLVANGVTIGGATSVSFLSNPVAATNYDVITYGAGGLTGFANLTAAWRGSFSNDALNQKVVFVTGNTAVRTWNTTSGTWDNTGTNNNWSEGDLKFYDGDSAVFGNIAGNASITLGNTIAPGTVTVQNAANTYTFSGSGLGGNASLTKANAGTLILTNNNSNTGTTTVSGGVLQVGNGGTTGSLGSGDIAVSTGAELIFLRSDNFTLSNVLSGAGLLSKRGAGRMTVSGNNASDALNWNFTGTGNGDIGFQNANAVGGVGSTLNIADNATGSAFLGSSGNYSSVAISIGAGGNFTWNGSTGNTNTLSGVISGSGTLTKVSGENLILTGNNSFSGAISVSGGGMFQIGGAGVIGSGNHAGSITTANPFFVNTSSNQILAGTISGGGRLDKSNTGILTLSGVNYYSGGTELLGGTLRVNALAGIGSGYLAVKNGAIFVYQGTGSEITSRNLFLDAGASQIEITHASASLTWNDSSLKNGAFTKSGAGTLVMGGAWSGNASVTVSAGTLQLNGNSTHSGNTMVSAGTLYITGALSNSAVIVDSDGVIGSAGSNGALNNGLSILAGGKLDLTGATLGDNSTGVLQITGGNLALGNLTFQHLMGWDWLSAELGTYKLIDGSFSVDFGNTAYISEATAYDFGNGKKGYFTQGSLNVVIVPETSTGLFIILGGTALLRRRSRIDLF